MSGGRWPARPSPSARSPSAWASSAPSRLHSPKIGKLEVVRPRPRAPRQALLPSRPAWARRRASPRSAKLQLALASGPPRGAALLVSALGGTSPRERRGAHPVPSTFIPEPLHSRGCPMANQHTSALRLADRRRAHERGVRRDSRPRGALFGRSARAGALCLRTGRSDATPRRPRNARRVLGMYATMRELGGPGTVVGVDEVGRGSVAGPLMVCAVALPDEPIIWGPQ